VAVAAVPIAGPLVANAPPAWAAPRPVRLAAPDAIVGSVMASQAGWSSAGRVVIVGAQAWSDALAASSLGAPLLYTTPSALSGVVAQEVRRLGATEAVVIGGSQAVGSTVRQQLRDMGVKVTEVWGADRYQTAAKVADLVPAGPNVAVASGETWADATAVAPLAAALRMPVFLARRSGLPVV